MITQEKRVKRAVRIIAKRVKSLGYILAKIQDSDINKLIDDWKEGIDISIYNQPLKTKGVNGSIVELNNGFLIRYKIDNELRALFISFDKQEQPNTAF